MLLLVHLLGTPVVPVTLSRVVFLSLKVKNSVLFFSSRTVCQLLANSKQNVFLCSAVRLSKKKLFLPGAISSGTHDLRTRCWVSSCLSGPTVPTWTFRWRWWEQRDAALSSTSLTASLRSSKRYRVKYCTCKLVGKLRKMKKFLMISGSAAVVSDLELWFRDPDRRWH